MWLAEENTMRLTFLLVAVLLVVGVAVTTAQDPGKIPEPTRGAGVVQDRVKGRIGGPSLDSGPVPKGDWLRLRGKATVLDARTLVLADGTEIDLGIDVPESGQKGKIGDSFYPADKDAAEFLKKLVGEEPVTCLVSPTAQENRQGKRMGGICFAGEVHLGFAMVQNGWAIPGHSTTAPMEIIARENKRGLWRGQFVRPDRWRTGERLPGE
jgi:endonuclease YncB( thermonuclease family)